MTPKLSISSFYLFFKERNEKITAFRNEKSVLVATDVAARGLDVPEIRNVVNFDIARDIDTHVHRHRYFT